MTTFATLFSGGELAAVGMRNAGLVHRWGIELDDAIAAVARMNGFNVITANILDIDPAALEPVDALHASPPCTRASNANQGAELNDDGTKEAPLDIALAEKVAEFIDVLRPRIFTLENVYQYRNFKAFRIICDALDRGGYFWSYEHVNAADYSVPQTRRRLILRAVRGALLPPLPAPEPWAGWLAAIEDLIPTLPDSKFAKWQLTRLPAEFAESIPVRPGLPGYWECADCGHKWVDGDRYGVCPKCNGGNFDWQIESAGILVSNAKTEYSDGIRDGQEPAGTVTGESNGRVRAFVIDQNYGNSNSGGQERILSIKQDNQPIFTLGAGNGDKREIRAWLVSGGNSFQPVLQGDEPSTKLGSSPSTNLHHRAWLSQGRVVKLTPRALARLQSVPDSYKMPTNRKQLESFASLLLGIPESLAHFVIERETTNNTLACLIFGNGVPCLMMEKIYRQLTAGG